MLSPSIEQTIRSLAETRPERSFYLYDPSVMAQKIADLGDNMPEGVAIYYAMKANPHVAFLETARRAGVAGVEIASLGEGRKAIEAGFAPNQIIFTGPGKSPEELDWSVAVGIRTIHVESLTEAHRLNAIAAAQGRVQDVLVRVNPNFHVHGAQANFSGDSSKLGMDQDRFRAALPEILALENLNFVGLHVYSASGVLEVSDLLKNCELVFALAAEIEDQYQGVSCSTIDFGGGFGIDYLQEGRDFAPGPYAEGLSRLISRFGFAGRRFVLELGRYLTADSGWYATEILDIKDSLGKKQVVCAGGSHHFRRPAALGINHPVSIVSMNRPKIFAGQESVDNESVFIGGPLCNTADRLSAKDVALAHAEIGDMAVFELAGAYGYSMSHLEFLSHAHPPEIVI
ncbi:MAG: alanine racemase [Alphaproteobacteria bacterium]|nr:alanine racemase [Alphaproteobacteria bacterium]